jgi:hypothetical protein
VHSSEVWKHLQVHALGWPPYPPLGAHNCMGISPTTFNNALAYLPWQGSPT